MSYKLSQFQKNEIIELLKIEKNLRQQHDLFRNIEHLMEYNHTFIPDSQSRESQVNDKVALLLETSKVASRLRLLLKRLDKVTTYQILYSCYLSLIILHNLIC